MGFDYQADRTAMGELPGRLTDRSFAETKDRPGGALMISALCCTSIRTTSARASTARPQSYG
jgi:hypothetical protein